MQLKIFEIYQSDNFSLKYEIIGGVTTFLSMLYIVVVNPIILSHAGIPFSGALTATVLVSFVSCLLMGIFSNSPIAVAPGMGINAFFTYAIVQNMQVSWQIALGIVFWSGIIFTFLSMINLRALIVKAIPCQVRYAVVCGIGLLIAVVGLKAANVLAPNPENLIEMADLNVSFILFLVGLLVTGVLIYYGYTGALIIGIIGVTVIYFSLSFLFPSLGLQAKFNGFIAMPDFSTFGQLDLVNSLSIAFWPAIFAFLFTTMFDSLAGIIGVCEVGNLLDEKGDPKNLKEILTVDGLAGVFSGIFGTSSAISYIESATGIKSGARTGVSAIIIGFLFLPFLFLSPLLSLVPSVATAPVLFIVGIYMMKLIGNIKWQQIEEAIPALITILIIPLTSSITHGMILGLLLWSFFRALVGKIKDISNTLIVLNILSIGLLIIETIF
ncbi:NCS2 family permease [Allofrancisella frigidaquae]|uniref:NCS2 family permease n=1 Tax=Allofrancisella frigidaquae TaxID=1085644 RepID=A0A6M3HSQ9_9GAMM|nr:NCS2 family permease [Allofrancisella frigidaquae]QIV94228.1 NCS2 family permease [Allofrancisella frigidaquae]